MSGLGRQIRGASIDRRDAAKEPGIGPSRKSSSLVLAGRLFLLLLAAGATVAAFVLSRPRDDGASGSVGRYVCPMHPEVLSSTPDECPICRMALEPARTSHQDAPPFAASSALSAESANLQERKVLGRATRRVFATEVRAPAWIDGSGIVTAVVYKHDLDRLSPGDPGLFFRASSPTVGVNVRLSAEPAALWDGSTSRVRFHLARSAPALGPGRVRATGEPVQVGWVKLAASSRALLVVPSGAVQYSIEGPYVLVAAEDGRTFSRRQVAIGRVYRGLAVISSGLSEQDPIVVANTFFLDAERRLRSQHVEAPGVTQ